MKIVILSQYFYPETGAPQNRLLELSRIFQKNNHEVLVITAMPNYPKGRIYDEYRNKLACSEIEDGIKINRYILFASNSSKKIPRIISMLSFSFTSLFSVFKIRRLKPDFIFVESPPLTLGISAFILSKFSGSKMIMNVSDIWPLSAKELGYMSDGFLYKKLESLEKFLYKRSFLCTGQSEEIITHVKNSGAKNTYLFRNGVDVNRFADSELPVKKEAGFKIVYAGLLGVAQGILDIIKNVNFKALNCEFHIYGEGAERKQVGDYLTGNADTNIFLHESVNREAIPELLGKFDCTIIPLVSNIYGAVPSKIYEAMAAGLPVLFSGSGEGAKIIEESRTGLVNSPRDFDGLTKNISEIKDNTELRQAMSVNGKNTAMEKFDRNKLISDFSDKLVELQQNFSDVRN